MVVPMKMFSFLVYYKNHQTFLEKLQSWGVLHLSVPEVFLPETHKETSTELVKVTDLLAV